MYKNMIYGLAYECPVKKRKENCPLLKFDELTFHEKYKKINTLSNEELKDIYHHHVKCLNNRTQELLINYEKLRLNHDDF